MKLNFSVFLTELLILFFYSCNKKLLVSLVDGVYENKLFLYNNKLVCLPSVFKLNLIVPNPCQHKIQIMINKRIHAPAHYYSQEEQQLYSV